GEAMSAEQPNVEFYFDPICPWCWMTSRWAAEVAETRGFSIDWRRISLKIINEGKELGDHQHAHDQGHRMGRVVEAARVAGDSEVVGKLYTEMGNRRHPDGREDFDAIIAESLAAAGADAALAAAADTDESDAQLRENTEHALKIA